MTARDPRSTAPSASRPAGAPGSRGVRPGSPRGFVVRPLASVLLALGALSFAAGPGATMPSPIGTESAATVAAGSGTLVTGR